MTSCKTHNTKKVPRKESFLPPPLPLSNPQTIEDMAKDLELYCHFNYVECVALLKMHERLSILEKLDRMRIRSILYVALDISDSFILDRIFRVADKNADGIINADEWLFLLSVMLRGTLDEMIAFCFDVYDVNGDRTMEREEILMCLEHTIKPRGDISLEELPDCIKDLMDITMSKLDWDNNGIITFSDYKSAVTEDPLLLQCLGVCIPPARRIKTFQYTFTWDYTNFYSTFDNSRTYSARHKRKKTTLPKKCDHDGHWHRKNMSGVVSEWTNYGTCAAVVIQVQKQRANVHVMAYFVSIIALIPALFVFFVYKQLRVHRIILHQNLFLSLLVNSLLMLAFKNFVILSELSSESRTSIINENGIGCRLLFILTKYSRMTNYMWMFCEGYYLHKLISAAFAEQKSLLVFYLLGWVFPVIPTAVYAGLRMYNANDQCWVVPHDTYEWVLNFPSLLSLLINLGFLINIIRVLVTKIAAHAGANEPSQYRKAVRATLVLLPLFGLHFVVTIYRPPSGSGSCEWIELYYYINYVMDGLQGFFCSVIFCYSNNEVVTLFRRTYSRWREQHNAGGSHEGGGGGSRSNNRNDRGRSTYTSVPASPEPGSITRLTITNSGTAGGGGGGEDNDNKPCMTNGKPTVSLLGTNNSDSGGWHEISLTMTNTDDEGVEMKQTFSLSSNQPPSTTTTTSVPGATNTAATTKC